MLQLNDIGDSPFSNDPDRRVVAQEYVKEEIKEITNHPLLFHTSGQIKSNIIDGVSIYFVNLIQKDVFKYRVEKMEDQLEMHFEINGSTYYDTNGKQNAMETLNGRYSFFYYPFVNGVLTYTPQNQIRRCIEIDLTIDFINHLFCGDLEILGDFGKGIANKQERVFAKNATITPAMALILRELLECKLSGVLKKAYLESKVIELLLLIIEQGAQYAHHCSSPFLSKEDIEKVYYAREIISGNMEKPYSIRELARISGLNEFKLKKGFRDVFDTTVFKYLLEIRMNHGKRMMILDNNKSIGEIATVVGYKNPTHFTAAFKRHFGYLPSDLKKMKSSGFL